MQISRVQIGGQIGTALCWARLLTARAGGRTAEEYAVLASIREFPDENDVLHERGMLHVIEIAANPTSSSGYACS